MIRFRKRISSGASIARTDSMQSISVSLYSVFFALILLQSAVRSPAPPLPPKRTQQSPQAFNPFQLEASTPDTPTKLGTGLHSMTVVRS
jgi:hypothetical protein